MIEERGVVPEHPWVREGIVWREIEGEFVIYDPMADRTMLVNLSAAAVIELCDGTRTAEEIAAAIQGIFSIPMDDAIEDVDALLQMLRGHGIMRSCQRTHSAP